MKLILFSLFLFFNNPPKEKGTVEINLISGCNNETISGALIILYNEKDSSHLVTNGIGRVVDTVFSGTYNMTIYAMGYEPYRTKDIVIQKNKRASFIFSMKIICQ
jgi:hypothetical protein